MKKTITTIILTIIATATITTTLLFAYLKNHTYIAPTNHPHIYNVCIPYGNATNYIEIKAEQLR